MLLLLGHLFALPHLWGHGSSVYKFLRSHSPDAEQLGFFLPFSLAAHDIEKGESGVTSVNPKGVYL
jgi:hypothetical protein